MSSDLTLADTARQFQDSLTIIKDVTEKITRNKCRSAKATFSCPKKTFKCTRANRALWSCHHHGLDCPRSRSFHLPKSQQKQSVCHRSAEHLSADVGLWSCHRHSLAGPMSLSVPSAKSAAKAVGCATNLLNIPVSRSCTVELSTTSVWIAPSHHRFHLPKWQQKQCLSHKCAEHSAADVGLWSCHHHGRRWPHVTTLPSAKMAAKAVFVAQIF